MSEPSTDLRCEWSDLPVYECAHCPADAREAARIAASRDFEAEVAPNDARVISGRQIGRVVSGRALDEGTPDWTLPGRNVPRSDAPCRYVPGYGHYLRSHLRTCDDRNCLGCEPCERDLDGHPVRHCTCREGCNEHLTPAHAHVAPRCIGKVRATLHAIETLDALMLDVAADTGVESEAANLAGPAADPAQWSARKVYAMRSGADLALMPEEDPHHPQSVLGTWDMLLREDYGPDTSLRVTVPRAVAYLTGQLDRLAQDPEQDWAQFAGEVRACLTHLEAVVHDSRIPEQGAPCPACARAPRLVKRYADHDATGAADTWRCPACRAEWTEAEYRLWVADDYLANAETLTAADMAMVHGVPASTTRRWASVTTRYYGGEPVTIPARIKAVGRDASGRKLYRVADVLAQRDAQEEGA